MKINKEHSNNNKEVSIIYGDDNSININVFNNKILMEIAGSFDNNLKELEKISGSKIYFRGNTIAIKGEKNANEKVRDAIEYLIERFKLDKKIDKNDIVASLNKDMIEDMKNQSPVQPLEEVIKTPKRSVIPRSKKQKEYVKALKTNQIIMSLGPAGTGKTYLAVAAALSMLLEKKVERIILSRPAVEAGEKLGFLPGDMKEKIDPYLRPLYDSLHDMFDYDKIQRKIESGEIEIAPLAFMRGRTLKNCFAILDEAQNATQTQIKMFLTRIGENSKLVVNGDPSQIDLLNKSHSGLVQSQNILKGIKEISIINFDQNDVIRHPLVTKIVEAYKKNTNDKG
jgi:phosphate starvation-inducible PhoH-like protein|tara:strand:- start:301 stop:1320 length:1020 start_codon:yes stop_codon:yes gene_type:complete